MVATMSHCADHNPEDRNDVRKIIEKFDQYSIGELHETFERYNFNSRNQEETEGIDTYGPIVITSLLPSLGVDFISYKIPVVGSVA